jgi:transcriptional regulator with XRE-family HTH domain
MRKSCGLTQKQLAEKAGILQPQLARLESARSSPNLSTLIAIAKSVGYSVEINFVPEKTEK